MTVQIVEIAGEKMAILPVAEYERLIELAEDQADLAAAERAEQRRLAGEEYVPFELVHAIVDGANALKVWREYRGMTQRQLAEMAGCRFATISELENGKAQGKPATWRKLAAALEVELDDILPLD
jgi:DNA-binding XRE family transcriptional regulator